MQFTEEEIELARTLRADGLAWTPRAGHYVFDETGFCQQPSPFQQGVYFILNYPYFMKTVGGVDRFKEIMTWLPTWFDCREILESLAVPGEAIAQTLRHNDALHHGCERVTLYRMIAAKLS